MTLIVQHRKHETRVVMSHATAANCIPCDALFQHEFFCHTLFHQLFCYQIIS